MNFLLKQQMQHERLPRHQACCSQQRLGKAQPHPPGGEGVRSSILHRSPGRTSEVAVSVQFSPSFALEARGRVHPYFLISPF